MAKRNTAIGKQKKSRSRKTKKRLAKKWLMLKTRAEKRKDK